MGSSEFDLSQESMGTRQAIELIPLFNLLSSDRNIVVVIDEIDRSLHTSMTRALIEFFLENYTKESRSQLIFTSHDTNLIDQSLFRRDEINLVERNEFNESEIYSIGDFEDINVDYNLESLYLQGRFGGIPKISL